MVTNAKSAATVIGLVLLIVGALGFVPNPIVGPAGIFVVNPMHNLIHVGSGIVLLIGAYSTAGVFGPGLALRVVGIVYAIVAVLGFVMPGDLMWGMAMNMADRWLHMILAVVILYAGFGLSTVERPATV